MYLSKINSLDRKQALDINEQAEEESMDSDLNSLLSNDAFLDMMSIYPTTGAGSSRIVLDAGSYVIKVAICDFGREANGGEFALYIAQRRIEQDGELPENWVPVPKAMKMEDLEGISCLYVEKCSREMMPKDIYPSWTGLLEDGFHQYGFSKSQGRWVCYDMSHDLGNLWECKKNSVYRGEVLALRGKILGQEISSLEEFLGH